MSTILPGTQCDNRRSTLELLASLTGRHAPRNRNPSGRNQHNCPPKEDPHFQELLHYYHRITTNRIEVSKCLQREHGIHASARTIARRWNDMGLKGSRLTEKELGRPAVIQLVADHMSVDPARQVGQNALKKQIALQTGLHITHDTIAEVQKILDPEGVASRHPTSKRLKRVALTSEGPNEVWCCDGHDKLVKYGFAIWGLRDKFSRKWLGLWVLPNNRIRIVVAYLWLTVVRDLGGIPKQSSTDCGTENTVIYGLANALKDTFGQEVVGDDKPAHIFLCSVHHIPIEHGWLDFRQSFGHSFPHFWGAGSGTYEEKNVTHKYLAMWLWPPLMQKELDKFREYANNHRVRKQKDKILPSGTTPSFAYTFPENYGGRNCLQPVDIQVIEEMLQDMRKDACVKMDWGVPPEFAVRCEAGLKELGVKKITLENVWIVFAALLRHVS